MLNVHDIILLRNIFSLFVTHFQPSHLFPPPFVSHFASWLNIKNKPSNPKRCQKKGEIKEKNHTLELIKPTLFYSVFLWLVTHHNSHLLMASFWNYLSLFLTWKCTYAIFFSTLYSLPITFMLIGLWTLWWERRLWGINKSNPTKYYICILLRPYKNDTTRFACL